MSLSLSKLSTLLVAILLCVAIAQAQFPVTSVVDEGSIAGRDVALDKEGKLLPWPMPNDTGYSYSNYFLSQWTIVWDQYNRQRLPYFYCCFDFDRTSFELEPDRNWANSTGYLRAMMTGFVERLYPYTGDPRTLEFLQNFVDYELENGQTPEDFAWAGVPYPSANPGAAHYSGWSNHGEDYVEPHVVGEDGYAYLRLYEMTGKTKYLRAAIRCADALVKNYKPGDEQNSPWPNRCSARDGRVTGAGKGMGPYSANVVEPIMLFDELLRIGQGDARAYERVREGAWNWLMQYPMRNNVWVGYFEDVQASMGNMNQVIPLEFARYVLLHPEKDPAWREHSRQLIEWVKTTPKWPKYVVHGATVTTEQGDGKNFCCNLPNQCCDSHSARLAAVEALYFAKTGDAAYKDAAYRTFNWVSYFAGLPAKAHAPFSNQWWFTDEFADGPRRMMDAFWALPEWAPADESHLVGSLSVVTKIAYGKSSVTYSTFDPDSIDVLRLDFAPTSVMAGGKSISRAGDLDREGYTWDETTHVMRLHHTSSRDIDITGEGGQPPSTLITFDDPHLPVGSSLSGYPAGVTDWSDGAWQIGSPFGKFGTFTLALRNPEAREAGFKFPAARIFVGIDIYNDGTGDATVRVIGADDGAAASVTLQPKELRRFRTGWNKPSSQIQFQMTHGNNLRFDNLAYRMP